MTWEVKPTKMCKACNRMYKFEMNKCPDCGCPENILVAGVIGNIEDVKKELGDNLKSTR